ncbi:MAG: hypothetical protein AABX10_00185 [Nanoarchaeota archaeon]
MISNTSPIIFFTKINKLELLSRLYSNIIITKEVEDELLSNNKPDSELIKRAIKENLISVKSPSNDLDLSLGKGENSAINLALELKDQLIIDDSRGIRVAQSLGIETLRTTSVILSAVRKKVITKKEALDLINKIIEKGYYISVRYYKELIDKLI